MKIEKNEGRMKDYTSIGKIKEEEITNLQIRKSTNEETIYELNYFK